MVLPSHYNISEQYSGDPEVIPWIHGPDDNGYATIKNGNKFYLVQLPDISSLDDKIYRSLQFGWPLIFGLRLHTGSGGVIDSSTNESKINELYNKAAREHNPKESGWPSAMEYNSDGYNLLTDDERDVVDNTSLEPKDIATLRLTAYSLEIEPEFLLHDVENNNINMIDQVVNSNSAFHRVIELFLNDNKKYLATTINDLPIASKKAMMIEFYNKCKEIRGGTKKILILASGLGFKTTDIKEAMSGMINSSQFVAVIAQIAKINGLGKTMTVLTINSPATRELLLRTYLDDHWKQYVGK